MISILGLIGLTSFTIDQKTKEIGIRKLMGARISDVVLMIATQFLKWISVSFLIAVPISYYIMFRWLNEFPYRIRLHWWLLISGGLIAILVAFATIGLQSQRAARANPADSLRYE
jgi:putative ABC transport system permease protein